MKYSFANDYSEGAHQSILDALCETNLTQTPGYGVDEFCERAKTAIRKAMNSETADIHFLVGGTQTNFTVISALLRPHQCVISSDLGHINAHETGAVEATGHKIIALPSVEGKITAEAVAQGGWGVKSYWFCVIGDGKVYAKSANWSAENTFSFGIPDGNYTVRVYCKDSSGEMLVKTANR